MAELLDNGETYDEPRARLRLSIRYRDAYEEFETTDLITIYWIGLFLGDTPLFADLAYARTGHDWDRDLDSGFFMMLDEQSRFLKGLYNTLRTGERLDFQNFMELSVRIVIGAHLLDAKAKEGGAAEYFDVLAIIQHGGPWHGSVTGCGGPAQMMVVEREALEAFFFDLLDEQRPDWLTGDGDIAYLDRAYPGIDYPHRRVPPAVVDG